METEVDNDLFNTKQNEINDWVCHVYLKLCPFIHVCLNGGDLH